VCKQKGQHFCWPLKIKNLETCLRFCCGSQASRANFNLFGLTIFKDGSFLNVRFPFAPGVALGEANVIAA